MLTYDASLFDSPRRHGRSLHPLAARDRLLANLFKVGLSSFGESTKGNDLAADFLSSGYGGGAAGRAHCAGYAAVLAEWITQ